MLDDKPILEFRNITKEFPGVKALDNINIEFFKGNVHALVGENGAGKSTLIKILAGVYSPDSGDILLSSNLVSIRNPQEAQKLGVSVIHQELNLVPKFNSFENIWLGFRYPRTAFGTISWQKLKEKVEAIVAGMKLDFDLGLPVGALTVAQQWMVAICRALVLDAKIIVMDEPTGSLSAEETEVLFSTIRSLKEKGISIIYVSHRLNEIFDVCEIVTVLKDAKIVKTVPVNKVDHDSLVKMIIGKEIKEMFPKQNVVHGDTILQIKDLRRKGDSKKNSFKLDRGEILGITGLIGSGGTKLARLIFGAEKGSSGEIFVDSKREYIDSPRKAIDTGIVLLPGERRSQGIFSQRSVAENITISSLKSIRHWPHFSIVSSKKETAVAQTYFNSLNIRSRGPKQRIKFLSGGNQQKVILARWLNTKAKIFLFDEPTRGIDVGSKFEIYKIIQDLANQGAGVILLSTELKEIVGRCDRVLVMRDNEIAAELSGGDLNEGNILKKCYGGT